MLNCRNGCNDRPRNNCCDDDLRCKKPTSGLTYDGCDLPMFGVRDGDSLNTVLENIHRSFKKMFNNVSMWYCDTFNDPKDIHLQVKPTAVHQVSLCGGIVPTNLWRVEGQDVVIDSSICLTGQVQVLYQGPMKNEFTTNCIY